MKRSYKIAALIVSVMLVVVAVSTMGVSYAIWSSADGLIEGGNVQQSPSATPDLENYVWVKYCTFEIIEEGKNDVVLTGFHTDDVGINLADVYIPNEIWVANGGTRINTIEERTALGEGNYTTYSVKHISNKFFSDSTLKELAVNIYIPSNITYIETMAFANLPNLECVYFLNENQLTIADYAFLGCVNLSKIEKLKGGDLKGTENAFIGCDKLSGVTFKEDGTITV